MYETYWPVALLVYYVVVFVVAFAGRSLLVYRRTGVNPLVLPSSDDAYGYVARSFKVVIAGIAAVVIALAFWPGLQFHFGRWTALSIPLLFGMCIFALVALHGPSPDRWPHRRSRGRPSRG